MTSKTSKKKEDEVAANPAPAPAAEKEDEVAATPAPAPAAEKEDEVAANPAPAAKKGITVENLTKTWFVQPSTGVRIGAGQTKLLEDDGWVKLQVDAKFFKVVG